MLVIVGGVPVAHEAVIGEFIEDEVWNAASDDSVGTCGVAVELLGSFVVSDALFELIFV